MLDLELAELDGMTPRERVFELVMRRLDAMAPYKDGLRTIAREVPRDPALLLAAGCNVGRLSRRLLDAAEAADPPAIAAVARRVIGAIYVRTFKVWLEDETPGHGSHAGRARPQAAAGRGDRALDPRLRPLPFQPTTPPAPAAA